MLEMNKLSHKNIRALRNPTQSSQPHQQHQQGSPPPPTSRTTCPCVRSKSMEDVRTDVVVDWPTYIKDNFNNLNNGRELIGNNNGIKNGNTRRSMDNLLKVDTSSYGRGFQVHI